jgi:transposase-like protein
LGITEQTYYRWRKQYGGMKVEQARRFKELEAENARLKKLVAETVCMNTNSNFKGGTNNGGRSPDYA